MENVERTIKTDKIYDGKILSLKVETVELPNKKYSKREIIHHEPAVGIIAINDDEEILLVKQYRKAVEKVLYEIPAGILEIGESPKECAIRELEEETGYVSDNLEYLIEFYATPGFCDEKIYIFSAKGLKKTKQNMDEDEFIDLIKLPLNEAIKMIELGEIIDAKTIAGILFYENLRLKNENER
ncbi:MAG: NUDIX hydrolase [Peptoniphilaceae bacterium]